MAATLLVQRDLSATKLNEFVRQLKRYMASSGKSVRNIEQRCKKIDVEKDELIELHYRYAEKAGVSINDEQMKVYITEKLDEAEDVLNEATVVLEGLSARDVEETKKTEIAIMSREIEMIEELLLYIVDEVSKVLTVENPTEDDVIKIENYLLDLSNKEGVLKTSFDIIRKTVDEKTAAEFYKKESKLKFMLSNTFSRMQLFVKKNKSTDDKLKVPNDANPTKNKNSNAEIVRLEKIKPPTFSGNIRNFARFKADFKSIIKPAYTDEMYLTYVLKESCLHGEAKELVCNLETEEEVWRRLEDKYGDTIEIVDSVITELQDVYINKASQDRGIVQLVDVLEKGVRDLTVINKRCEIANAYTVKLIEQKLPRRVMMKWLEEKDNGEGKDRFEGIYKFLKEERKRVERLIQHRDVVEVRDKNNNKGDKRNKKANVNSADVKFGGSNDNKRCLIHENSSHLTRKCKQFLSKSVDERNKIVTDLNACQLCLSSSHIGNPCPWLTKWNPCDVNGCGEYHSRLLHDIQNPRKSYKASSELNNGTLLLIQNVTTANDNNNNLNDIVVFWDSGSNISLVRDEYARKQKLTGISVSYELITLGNIHKSQNTMLFDVPIYDRKGQKHIIKAYGINEICYSSENIHTKNLVKIFKNLNVKDVERYPRNVDILIGMDHADIQPEPMEKYGNLVLYRSWFGTGKLIGGQHEFVRGIEEVKDSVKTVAHARSVKIEVLKPQTGIDFFSAESFGVDVPAKCRKCKSCKECTFDVNQFSRCEQFELETIKRNLILDEINKKWTTTYPYKMNPVVIKDNRNQAETFLKRTEKRISKNDFVNEQYCKQFRDLIFRGVFREIPVEELNEYDGPTFYVTHHEVYKEESSSTPVRIVSNTSLKNKDGVSLNDILMKGPNSLNNIFGIQLRFRTYPCALVGDISKMYNSINTTIKERHLRRIMWRSMNVDEIPKVYGVEKVMFGDKPAAAISATAILLTAERFSYMDEEAANKIKMDIYVDDITSGGTDHPSTLKLKENIRKILNEGGFHVKGFVMSGDSSEESLSLLGTGEIGRILGIGWKPYDDVFVARVRINTSRKYKGIRKEADLDVSDISALSEGKLSRRMLLSITNSCYDPLGVLSPVTVQLKIELRKLYSKELSLSWDADIPFEMKQAWVKLVRKLKSIDGIEMRRCVHDSDSIGNPELVIFCDGSPLAMCAAAYIRWKLQNGGFSSYLFAAKTRVTPLARLTIPRVEMQSAVLGVRLGNSIIRHSGYKFQNVHYISDSTCTIATLKKDSVALKEYMGNRVAEINASTKINQWHHVKSEENIADLGTRMEATLKDIVEGSKWQTGPKWLREDITCWPVSKNIDVEIPEDELSKKGICYYSKKKDVFMDISKYKSYSFLINLTARLILTLKLKSFKVNELTLESLEKAEEYWIKQSMYYTKAEFLKGKLRSLRPIVRDDVIVVVWGLICTCATVRAVYLDVAEAYSSDAVIQTLRKFVAIRGCPSKFICDQGSQLKAIVKADVWDWTDVRNWAVSNKITWDLIPADSQHKNGLSESMIKSIKRTIRHVIGGNVLSFSEFQLMLYEVANIVNSRPIGIVTGSDPEIPNPITPNDLILGRSTNGVPQGPFEVKPTINRRFEFVQKLIDNWWDNWFISVLPSLVPSYKWFHKCRNVTIGDICLISYKGTIRSSYR